jgi:hypothetical protein
LDLAAGFLSRGDFIEPVIESPPETAPRWRMRTTKVLKHMGAAGSPSHTVRVSHQQGFSSRTPTWTEKVKMGKRKTKIELSLERARPAVTQTAWQGHQTKGSSTHRFHRARGSAHRLVKHVLYLSSRRPAPRVAELSGRDHSGIRHVRHEASRGAPRPRAIGENKRARPAFDHDPREGEAECERKEFAERYVHISCVTTVRRRLPASEPPSRPFVVRTSTSAGTMLHVRFFHHSTRDNRPAQHTGRTRLAISAKELVQLTYYRRGGIL